MNDDDIRAVAEAMEPHPVESTPPTDVTAADLIRIAEQQQARRVDYVLPYRQPAYDAVHAVIRRYPPRCTDERGIAVENARVWDAVDAALDAMGVPGAETR